MTPEEREIRASFLTGDLRVRAVCPQTGEIGWYPVKDVMRHQVCHKRTYQVTSTSGTVVCTEDHSLFIMEEKGIRQILTSELKKGDLIAVARSGSKPEGAKVLSVEEVDTVPVMYDLCIPGPENFILSNGVVAHNSYSIGGISLDIDKSSKYQGMKDNAEQQFEKAAEAKSRTTKYIRGLKQPKYGFGVRSSFGPQVGRGVLSPRSFV